MPAQNKQRPPFRAEHMGSLLRPKNLTEKRIKLDDAKALEIAQDKELHAIEDESIKLIVKLQQELGYHALNDGEYRRHQFWGTFFPNLEGFEEIQNPSWDMFRMYVPDIAAFSEWSLVYLLILRCHGRWSLNFNIPSQPSPATNPVRVSCAPARSSTWDPPTSPTGTTSRHWSHRRR